MLKKFRKKPNNHAHHAHRTPKINDRLIITYAIVAYAITILVISGFAYNNYDTYVKAKRLEMEAAAYEIEMNFTSTLGYAESVLNYINRQISVSKADNLEVSKILGSFNQSHYGYNSIKDVLSAGMFYWIDSNKRLVASSAGPISPIDLSARDYLENTKNDPWKIYTGMPVVGAASGQYVIPAGVGVVDIAGEYVGTSVVSFKLYNLTEKFKHLVSFYKTDFAILDANNKVLLESETGLFSEDHELMDNLNFSVDSLRQEMVSCLSPFKQKGSFIILRNAQNYPYKILIGYQNSTLSWEILCEIMPQFIEILIITMFFVTMLVLFRVQRRKE
ncbi:MAG: cache domain-containing protein [Pseudomonadota bacterium]